MATKIEKRVELALGEPNLYVLFGAPEGASRSFGPSWADWVEDKVAKVHVISPSAGGEVRGYWLTRGALYFALPLYPMEWPELDAEVERATGLKIRGVRP